jgi:hypothetical protein
VVRKSLTTEQEEQEAKTVQTGIELESVSIRLDQRIGDALTSGDRVDR